MPARRRETKTIAAPRGPKERGQMAETAQTVDLKKFLSSMRLSTDAKAPTPMISNNMDAVKEDVSNEDRFLSGLAILVHNVEGGKVDKARIQDLTLRIDQIINDQVNEILHHPKFQQLESTWRGLEEIVKNTNFKANVMIDFMDVTKDELYDDFEANSTSIANGAFFRQAYTKEYDQYGGKPFGGIIGLYEFEHTPRDLFWLRQMGKVANASHAPFVSAVSPKFFGCETIDELAAIKDLEGMLNQPKYGAFQALRDTPEASYIGLTLPRY